MSTNRFQTLINGVPTIVTAIFTSAGAGDGNKIVATASNGRLDPSVMPVGIGAQTQSTVTSEALTAGDFVNIFNNAGTPTARKADASNGRYANGFVLSNTTSGQNALVYFSGTNTSVTALVPGTRYYLSATTAGTATATAPAAPNGIQVLGVASTSTSLPFEFDTPIEQS